MNDAQQMEYHKWLLTRSIKGLMYRKLVVYPAISRHLKAGKTLDVGCGIGDFLAYSRGSAIGADINEYNVKYCNERGLSAYSTDSMLSNFDSESFDNVLLDNVLEHIYSPEDLLKSIYRVVKFGGFFVVGIPELRHFFHDKDHKVHYSMSNLNLLMKTIGFFENGSFCTPESVYVRKHFKHSCRWFVFKK